MAAEPIADLQEGAAADLKDEQKRVSCRRRATLVAAEEARQNFLPTFTLYARGEMKQPALYAAMAAAALLLIGTVQAQPAAEKGKRQTTPATKDKSAERKATPPARSSYDITKGPSVSRKKPDAAARGTTKPRQGLEANGTTAQGLAHE